MTKQQLRAELRRKRTALPPVYRKRAARRAAVHAQRVLRTRGARHVAIYLTMGSELDTLPLLRLFRGAVFVPQLRRSGMRFVSLGNGQPRPARHFDVIVLPLLAFDARGTRLGQGGGHYDRALSFRRIGRRPLFVGYAYSVQEAEALPCEAHDVRLDAVITERGMRWLTG